MFKLGGKPIRVLWPVIIEIPISDGKTASHKIQLKFEIQSIEEQAKYTPSLDNLTGLFDPDGGVRDLQLEWLKKVIVGWKDVQGPKAPKDLPFTEKNLENFLGIPYVRAPALAAYTECASGRKAKN